MKTMDEVDVAVIGAGPAGVLVTELLHAWGARVMLIEAGTRGRLGDAPEEIDEESWRYRSVGAELDWLRVHGVGGRSLAWGAWLYRFPAAVFREGGWPLSLEMLAPFYSRVEEHLGVISGRLHPAHRAAARALKWPLVAKRGALTARGKVWTARHSPVARWVRTRRIALALVWGGRRAAGVRVLDGRGRVTLLRARTVVLAASPVETTRILLASRLHQRAPAIGRDLVYHPFAVYAMVDIGPAVVGPGPFPGSSFVPRFVNLAPESSRNYRGGFSLEINGPRRLAQVPTEIRAAIRGADPPPHASVTFIAGLADSFPHTRRYVDLAPRATDRLGRPVPQIHFAQSAAERRLVREMKAACVALAEQLGTSRAQLFVLRDPETWPTLFHEAGTCRMGGSDAAPCRASGQLRALDNVWIADASTLPSAGDRHPTLTVLALAWRAAAALRRAL